MMVDDDDMMDGDVCPECYFGINDAAPTTEDEG